MSRWVATATADIALSAATVMTVLQLQAPTNSGLTLFRVGVSFDGLAPDAEPVTVELYRQSKDGTFTALTPKTLNQDDTATAQHTAGVNASVEPTSPTVALIDAWLVHPQGGVDAFLPLGMEVYVTKNLAIGLRCTAPAVVNCRPKFWYESA